MRPDWVDRQLRARGIPDPRVLEAMRVVPRESFVPVEARTRAYDDAALALGHGQTISQPYVVALICQALSLEGDELVLDVGTGSGYQAAVLDELAGRVVSVERIPELAEEARGNLAATGHSDGGGARRRRLARRAGAGAVRGDRRGGRGSRSCRRRCSTSSRPAAGSSCRSAASSCASPTEDGRWRMERLAPVRFVPLVTGFPG